MTRVRAATVKHSNKKLVLGELRVVKGGINQPLTALCLRRGKELFRHRQGLNNQRMAEGASLHKGRLIVLTEDD